MHLVKIIIDSLAEGRSRGYCAGVSTSRGHGRMLKEVLGTLDVHSAVLRLVKVPGTFYSWDSH